MPKTPRLKDDERLLIEAVSQGETISHAAKRLKINDDRRAYIVRTHGIREQPNAKDAKPEHDDYL